MSGDFRLRLVFSDYISLCQVISGLEMLIQVM